MEKIFYLEPYVYKQVEEDHFLLYNTLTGKYRFMKNEEELMFLKKMADKEFLILNDAPGREVNDFIRYLQINYFGEIREVVDDTMHYQHSPKLVVNLVEYEYNKKSLSDYFKELTLYINGECTHSCPECKTAHKQFPFCTKLNGSELNYVTIEGLLSNFSPDFLMKININGGNILCHGEFVDIVHFLNSYSPKKYYYIHHKNITVENVGKLSSIGSNSFIVILFSNIPSISELSDVRNLLKNVMIPLKWIFVLQHTKDVQHLEQLELDDLDYELQPFMNSGNKAFIKKNVFLTSKDILSAPKFSYKQILEKNKFNLHLWGKTYIMNNGDFHANLNSDKLGNVVTSNAYDPIHAIIKEQKDVWYLTRKDVSPCDKCVYRIFCPPISNYELFSKKFNMCVVKG